MVEAKWSELRVEKILHRRELWATHRLMSTTVVKSTEATSFAGGTGWFWSSARWYIERKSVGVPIALID